VNTIFSGPCRFSGATRYQLSAAGPGVCPRFQVFEVQAHVRRRTCWPTCESGIPRPPCPAGPCTTCADCGPHLRYRRRTQAPLLPPLKTEVPALVTAPDDRAALTLPSYTF
jgi:hypothetical protein